ncbi:hypothetical protein D7V97_33835 [Corallococcus sp. CA053C]|nr:hypothetical protein D7V97_33835 [Corallococcus sp. CA053C]
MTPSIFRLCMLIQPHSRHVRLRTGTFMVVAAGKKVSVALVATIFMAKMFQLFLPHDLHSVDTPFLVSSAIASRASSVSCLEKSSVVIFVSRG